MPELPIPTPEVPRPTPETGPVTPETTVEHHPAPVERPVEQPVVDIYAGVLPAPAASDQTPTAQVSQQVEQVMSEGLAETYQQLDPATKEKFKTAGEQTARQISVLLQETKVQVKKIIDLLLSWLRIIPGLNKHFIEQEAKIKADKLLSLRQPKS